MLLGPVAIGTHLCQLFLNQILRLITEVLPQDMKSAVGKRLWTPHQHVTCLPVVYGNNIQLSISERKNSYQKARTHVEQAPRRHLSAAADVPSFPAVPLVVAITLVTLALATCVSSFRA